MKIGLGTVQFGTDYGISNMSGKTAPPEVERILMLARENGVQLIDTASMYGDSEEVMGHFLDPGADFNIVTKTPAFKDSGVSRDQAGQLVASFHQSLERLDQKSLYGLLVHHAADLLQEGGELLLEAMEALKSEGLVRKIGVSVYTGEEIDRVLDIFCPDIVQLPVNVFDQRLIRSEHLRRLKQLGVEIHARSIFLQGLLLIDPGGMHAYFSSLYDHLNRYAAFVDKHQLSRLQAALWFVSNVPEIDVALVGVSREGELREILLALGEMPKKGADMSGFAITDAAMINPAEWSLA